MKYGLPYELFAQVNDDQIYIYYHLVMRINEAEADAAAAK